MIGIILIVLITAGSVWFAVWDKDFTGGFLIWIFSMLLAVLTPTLAISMSEDAKNDYSDVIWDEPIPFDKVYEQDGKYIITYGEGSSVFVAPESDVVVGSPTGEGSIQFGADMISWGMWLPFDDWENKTVVRYTPGVNG